MNRFGGILAGAALCVLSACEMIGGQAVKPTPAALPLPNAPSVHSADVQRYYANVQNDLLVRGLLRTDGGGPDTPYSADAVARNFERIAFYDEHEIGAGLERSSGEARLLARWDKPVRLKLTFGDSVAAAKRATDKTNVAQFTNRLAQVSGHPVSLVQTRPNFNVLVFGEDDRAAMTPLLTRLLPNLSAANRALLQNLPRDMHCLVVVSHEDSATPRILSAVALIRSEHPDLLRQACFHEEIAQGLGLVNDSPQARPSIFNDDDEFALLTGHDEILLSMLYDTRLQIGMTIDQARPIIRLIAREKLGQNL